MESSVIRRMAGLPNMRWVKFLASSRYPMSVFASRIENAAEMSAALILAAPRFRGAAVR